MRVVIAEKGEAARDIAGALLGKNPQEISLPANEGGWLVCAASGHLLRLAEPAEIEEGLSEWKLEDLPISFTPWKKVAGGGNASKKLAVIIEALRSADEIYCCGDADDEGQLIVDEILEYAGIRPDDARCKRVYVNDNLPENIVKAFGQARPNADCISAGKAAHARQLADMCFGVNESRLATCKLGAKVALGRVQTPTLGLVIARDMAREGHVERKYYELVALVPDGSGDFLEFTYKDPALCEDGKHCFDRASLEEVARAIVNLNVQFDMTATEKELAPPLPFEITSLQADMSRRCGLTAKETLEATQVLRDKYKAITYNRTDSPYLKEEHHAQAPELVKIVQENLDGTYSVDTSLRSRAFNEKKTTAHHGIIPQMMPVRASDLPQRERDVYTAIAQRYLGQFMDKARYTSMQAQFDIQVTGHSGTFEYAGKFLQVAGWTAQLPAEWNNVGFAQGAQPRIGLWNAVVGDSEIREKDTAPPKAFTDGTLASAMANIARYVDDEQVRKILIEKDAASPNEHGSIGTAATRADIIDGLVEHDYLQRLSDKRKSLVSTPKARALWALLPPEIKGVETTARWWLMQQDVATGNLDEYAIMRDVCAEFDKHSQSAYAGMTLKPTVGKCPLCGRNVIVTGKVYSCETNKAEKKADGTWESTGGCGFKLYPWCGKVFTPKQAEALLRGKAVTLKGCVSKKTGKKFDCKVTLAGGKITPEFQENNAKQTARTKSRRW